MKMTDLINNIVKESCIPDDLEKEYPGASVQWERRSAYVRFIQSY